MTEANPTIIPISTKLNIELKQCKIYLLYLLPHPSLQVLLHLGNLTPDTVCCHSSALCNNMDKNVDVVLKF